MPGHRLQPLTLNDELVRRHHAGRISFARPHAFLLDEYVSLPTGHSERYRNVSERDFADRLDFSAGAVHAPDGNTEDLAGACADYKAAIEVDGGVHAQLLGIGIDRHIAFNEPGSSAAGRTRIKTLTAQTRLDNARFFGGDADDLPRHCLTQGLGTIMAARHLVLLATVVGHADAVHHMVEGAISAMWPAIVVQHHPHVSVLIDDAAASRLRPADYFRQVWAGKPAWQVL